MRIAFIGDVYAEAGIQALEKFLPKVRNDHPHDILLINGENIADGLGIRRKDYKTLMSFGAHAVTLGNHAFSKRELFDFIDEANIVRPLNYPKDTPGEGLMRVRFNEQELVLLQIMGRIFMHDPLNNPFEALDEVLESLEADAVIVDVHAETTSEKLALGHYLDGRVDAVVGTHTHVQTNDAMTLPKGTLYITDIGMTGAKYGILGADKDTALKKFTTGMPVRLRPQKTDIYQLGGVLIDTEKRSIENFHYSD